MKHTSCIIIHWLHYAQAAYTQAMQHQSRCHLPPLLRSSFSHYQKDLILQTVRQRHSPKLQRAHPSRHLIVLHGIEHIPKLIYLLIRIVAALTPSEPVQFLIIIILYLLADSSQQTLLLTRLMLTAALHILNLLDRRHLINLATFQLPLQPPLTYIAKYKRCHA